MTQALLAAVLVAMPVGASARPQDDGAKKAPADAARVVRALLDRPVQYGGDPRTAPLIDVLRDLSKQFDLAFFIDTAAFENPAAVADAKAARLAPAGQAKLTLGRFLDVYLRALDVPDGVTYIVRPNYIEITTRARAARPQDDGAKTGGKPAAASFDPAAAKIVSLLHNQPVRLGLDLQTAPLSDVLKELSKTYDLTFVIDTAAFETPAAVPDFKAANLNAHRLDGLTLGRFLDVYLRALPVPEQVTYLVRDYGVEITSRDKALNEAGLTEAMELADGSEEAGAVARAKARMKLPLVSVVAEDRPLGEVVKELARAYNLNLIIDRAARDRVANEVVMARLLNVPADTALELLAEQADLQVVRKGNTFRITAAGGPSSGRPGGRVG